MNESSLDLSHGTLAAMVSSSIEVYPKETAGLLFGIIDGPRIQCTLCQPIQEAQRSLFGVVWDQQQHDRLKKSVVLSTGFKFLGVYHSHPNSRMHLSPEDQLFMEQNKFPINVVLSLRPKGTRLSQPWTQRSLEVEGLVHGFEITLGGFHYEDGRVSQITMMYPLLETANLIQTELKTDLYDLAQAPDDLLVKVHYQLNKIEYHVRRNKGRYNEDKIQYATSRILDLMRPFVQGSTERVEVVSV